MGLQSIDIKQERIRNQWPSQDEPNSLIIKDLQGTKDAKKGETLAGVSPNLLLRRIVLKLTNLSVQERRHHSNKFLFVKDN